MQYLASDIIASKQNTDCVVVGVYVKRSFNEAAARIDKTSRSYLSKVARSGDLPAALGKTTMLRQLPGIRASRILVVGLGKKSEFGSKELEKATEAAVRALDGTGAKSVIFNLAPTGKQALEAGQVAYATITAAQRTLYRFSQMKSKAKPASRIKSIGLGFGSKDECEAAKSAFLAADAVSAGVSLTRDLGNLPANVCTPEYLADTAKDLDSTYKSVTTQVHGLAQIKKLKMGAFLSVTQGADRPPRLIVMKYKGGPAKQAPVALVGKGITFDTGGISLKPPASMDEMKYDMCGAASVLGTMKAIARMKLPINVVGIIAACENMPSGTATRPGDIVTSMSGKTVEILNTDAEGRLILCDALHFAKQFKPRSVIDIATLTGACVMALGEHFSGLMTAKNELADDLLQAGQAINDTAWRLPMTEDYVSKLKSNFADFANVGGRPAGATTAACFLWQFMKDENWAHLDIAGSAWKTGAQKGATGRPVALLVQYLANQA